jgi:PAS domain S-box-containing protein/putative nucleotidyltransferase with HDIG domain
MADKRPTRPVRRKTGETRRKAVPRSAEHIFEVLPDLIFRLDAEGVFLEFMGRSGKDLYRKPEEFLGRKVGEVLPAEVAEFLVPQLKKVIESGQPASVEYLLPMPGGSQKYEARLVPSGSRNVLVLVRNISPERQVESGFWELEERYHGLVELSPSAIAVHDGKTILYVNKAAADLLAAGERHRVVGRPVKDFVHPDSRKLVARRIKAMAASRVPMALAEEVFLRADGSPVEVEAAAASFQQGERTLFQVIFRDISRRKADEAALARLARLNAFLSGANKAIARASEPDGLLRAVCRVAVEQGGMRAAWAGLLAGEGADLHPVAEWGDTKGYPEIARITSGTGARGRGPTGTAIREGRVAVCGDIQADPAMAPWRVEALRRGFRSSAALPIRRGGRALGALNLYAAEPGAFGEGELDALESLAADLEFALGALDHERRRREAEAALAESEENFRGLFEHSTDAIYLTTPDGRILSCNAAAFRLFGMKPGDLETLRAEDLYDDPADRARFKALVAKEGEASHFEVRLRRRDGTRIDCLLSAVAKRGVKGEVVGYQGIIHDITKRKRMEEALRSSEQRYRGIFMDGPLGMLVVGLDGRFLQANTRFCRMLGYEESELVGRSFAEITHSDHVAADREALGKLVRGEIPLYHTEKRYLRKDGGVVWVDLTVTPIRDDAGAPLFFHTQVEDITAQRTAREAVVESERRLLQAQAVARMGSYLFDIPGNRWTCSPVLDDIFGIGPDYPHTVEGWVAILHPEDRDAMMAYWAARQRDRARFDRVYRIVRPSDGQERWVHGLGEVEAAPDGSPARLVGTIRDITEERRTGELLRIKDHAIATAINAIAMADLEGRLSYVNASFLHLWGYGGSEEVLGRPVAEFWTSPEGPAAVLAALEGEGAWSGEMEARRKDGGRFLARLSAHLVRGEDGRPVSMMATFLDVTEQRTMEAALRASEQRFRDIVEHSADMFYSHGPDHVLSYVSPRSRAILGCEPEEALIRWTEFVTDHPVNAAGFEATQRAIDTGTAQPPYELQLKTRDGRIVWVEVREAPVVRDGRTASIVGAVTDITSRKAAEEALQESEEQMRSLSDNLAEGMVYQINSGREGTERRFTYLSPAVERLHGVAHAEAMADPSCIYRQVVKEDRRALAEAEAAAAEARTALNIDVQVRLPSGELRWRRFISNPRTLPGGDLVWDGIELDITERKRAGAALRESEEKYRTLVESARDAILVADAETGLIVDVNRQAETLMGRPAAELLGMPQSQLHPPEHRERYRRIFAEHSHGDNLLARDLLVRRADGTDVPVDISATVVEVGGRRLVQGVFQDITDRKWAEKALQESLDMLQKSMQGTILAMMTMVEMRDPFTAGHQSRVARLACAIGRAMGMNEQQVEGLRVAGLLHDIGKIGVPAEILSKPGRILDFEYNIIKSHSEIGWKILKEIEFPWPIAAMVLHHHERLDGSGYPAGLKAKEIMLESRILVVADVVEAMASHRPYRPARGLDLALGEVEVNKGILYDPDVVDACVALFRDHRFTLD